MKSSLKIISVLTLICVLCAVCLSIVAGFAADKIERNQKEAVEQALFTIAPSADRIDPFSIAKRQLYKLFDKEGILLGYGFLAGGQGYGGTIKIMAVMTPDLNNLLGMEVIESVETPGLGAKIREISFKEQFKSLSLSPKIEYTKDKISSSNQIRAITGATVSSKAVVNILNSEIEQLRKIID
ncbi:MAG: FMN-binding protein [Candidatus Omnitrophota bacterium]